MENVVELAQKLFDKAPEEFKIAAPMVVKTISNINDVISAKEVHENDIKPLSNLCYYLKEDVCLDQNSAKSIVNKASYNSHVSTNSTDLENLLMSENKCKSSVCFHIREIEADIKSYADKVLLNSCTISFFFIVIELIRLINFWESVKESRNLIENTKIKKTSISKAIENAKNEIAILNGFIERLTEKYDEVTKIKAMRQIDKIRKLLNDIQNNIRELEIRVGNLKVNLGAMRTQQKVSAISSFLQGTSSAVNVGIMKDYGSSTLLVITSGLAFINYIMSTASIASCILTMKDVERLQIELDEIAELENQRITMSESFENLAIQTWDLVEARAVSANSE